MKRRTEICLAVLLFLIGTAIFFYPHITGAWLKNASSQAAENFIDSLAVSDVPDTEEALRPYPELYEAMQEYNEKIYSEHQTGLCDPWAYETMGFELGDYGIEDEVIAVLSIPTLELEMPIYLGASNDNMAKGAAVLGQTSLPIGGENTNCVIAGHRGWSGAPYFRYIDKLKEGDEVCITNLWETLTYAVSEIRIIEPNDIDQILIQDGRELITLLTCHPYASGGRYRYLVFCERVKP